MSRALAATSLETLLQPDPDSASAQLLKTNAITPYLQTLEHFETVTFTTVGSPIAQYVVKSAVLKIAMEIPYLMHATLAVAATHLKHLLPEATHPKEHRQYAYTESYHWQRALSGFQAELRSPSGLGQHNMDSLLSTCMLFAILSFSFDDFDPRKSFVFNDSPSALNWLSIQKGLKGLLIELSESITKSVWMPVFIDTAGGGGVFLVRDVDKSSMPQISKPRLSKPFPTKTWYRTSDLVTKAFLKSSQICAILVLRQPSTTIPTFSQYGSWPHYCTSTPASPPSVS